MHLVEAVPNAVLPPPRSRAIEDYLKVIHRLQQEHPHVTTSLIAADFGYAPASVTGMLQRLARRGFVSYTPYHGVSLTSTGLRVALATLRQHRLLELYLVQMLGYSWEEVHAEAEVLEHVMSATLEARIAARLGHPTVDPHGDPIPASDGTMPAISCQSLNDLALGVPGQIVRVKDQDPERLRYLAALELVPGAIVTVLARAPFDGPLTFRVGNATQYLDHRIAHTIAVREPIGTDAHALPHVDDAHHQNTPARA